MAESRFTRTAEKQFVVSFEHPYLGETLVGAMAALGKRAEEGGYVRDQYVPKTLLFSTIQSVSTDDAGKEKVVWATEASAVFWIVAIA